MGWSYKILSAKERLYIPFLQNVIPLQTVSTGIARSWEWSDISWKAHMPLSKASRCLPFTKVSVNFLRTCKIYGNVNSCRWFTATQIWTPESVQTCKSVYFVFMFIFEFFERTCWFSHIEVLIKNCANLERHSTIVFWETILPSEN